MKLYNFVNYVHLKIGKTVAEKQCTSTCVMGTLIKNHFSLRKLSFQLLVVVQMIIYESVSGLEAVVDKLKENNHLNDTYKHMIQYFIWNLKFLMSNFDTLRTKLI